jgi:hypothetical protein
MKLNLLIIDGSLLKASHKVRGFVATLGTSLDEFARDIRSILDLKLKNLYKQKPTDLGRFFIIF